MQMALDLVVELVVAEVETLDQKDLEHQVKEMMVELLPMVVAVAVVLVLLEVSAVVLLVVMVVLERHIQSQDLP